MNYFYIIYHVLVGSFTDSYKWTYLLYSCICITGKRTIGVVTKIDIMDKGTNARDILFNQTFPLSLGMKKLILVRSYKIKYCVVTK